MVTRFSLFLTLLAWSAVCGAQCLADEFQHSSLDRDYSRQLGQVAASAPDFAADDPVSELLELEYLLLINELEPRAGAFCHLIGCDSASDCQKEGCGAGCSDKGVCNSNT